MKIDHDIPIPAKRKWPFDQLKIGDSFAVNLTEYKRVTSAAWDYAKRNSVKFTVRKVAGKQVRVWRVE